jgi:uncharacterized membrane protein
MTDRDDTGESTRLRVYNAERAKAFIDAVVAIAMTLLILPLMESVAESASRQEGAAVWLHDHQGQLVSFVLSFAIIAMFWINHHRLFAVVENVSVPLLWITMAWLLSIVWLPVATAMSGQMKDTDNLVKALYIGSMILTSLLTLTMRIYLSRHPALHAASENELRRGMSVDISMALLFGVALTIAMIFPALSYWPMFVMVLVGPVQGLIARLLGAGPSST